MTKDKYETPEMEIIVFETEDVITTSGIDGVDDLLEGLLLTQNPYSNPMDNKKLM